jgi:hypothetical protein
VNRAVDGNTSVDISQLRNACEHPSTIGIDKLTVILESPFIAIFPAVIGQGKTWNKSNSITILIFWGSGSLK